MKKALIVLILFSLLLMCSRSTSKENTKFEIINLPKAKVSADKQLVGLLNTRQSTRQFKSKELSLEEISLLLWASIGKKIDAISSASRTVPSAGACHPIDIYLYIQKDGIMGIGSAFYQFLPQEHVLKKLSVNIDNNKLRQACWNQSFITDAPVVIIVAAVFERSTKRYGTRGERYVYLDAGHVGENIYLMATELGLATVEVGAFDDYRLSQVLELPPATKPILVMPVGYAQ